MRLFELRRDTDETGISGTGVVAQGVIFDNGQCAMTWLTKHTSTAVYASIDDVVAIHGHNGSTRVVQIADGEVAAVREVLNNIAQDHMEKVFMGLGKTADYLFSERDKLAAVFHEKAL